jgi:hypothetical protein
MQFRIAEMCGRHDVDAMADEMTPEQMDEWIAYDQVNPIGLEKVCWVLANGLAHIANTIYRAWGCKDYPETNPRDLIPWMKLKKRKPKDPYMNPNQQALVFQAWASRR